LEGRGTHEAIIKGRGVGRLTTAVKGHPGSPSGFMTRDASLFDELLGSHIAGCEEYCRSDALREEWARGQLGSVPDPGQ
jgi:hypothetical protein